MRRKIAILTADGESRQKLIIPSASTLHEFDPAVNDAYDDTALNVYMRSKVARKGDYRSWTRWGPWSCGDGTCIVLWGYTAGTTPHVAPWCLDGEDYTLFDDAIIARFAGEDVRPVLPQLEEITAEHIACVRGMCPGLQGDEDATKGGETGACPATMTCSTDATDSTIDSTLIDDAVGDDLLCYESYTYPPKIEWTYPNADAIASSSSLPS